MQKTIDRYREYAKEKQMNNNTFEVVQHMEVRFLINYSHYRLINKRFEIGMV